MGPKMSNIHDGDEKIPTPSALGRIRVNADNLTNLFVCRSLLIYFKNNFSQFNWRAEASGCAI